jgi:DNA helicase HerA-like ATPase
MLIGTNTTGDVHLGVEALLRHMACLGASGSGKTVFCKVVVEEAIRKGVPVIALDPQGDIASFALPTEHGQAERKGVPPAVVRDYCDKVEPVIYTPGSTAGIQLSANPFRPLTGTTEDQMRQTALIAKTIAGLIGYGGKQEVEAVLESALMRQFHRKEGSGFEGLASTLERSGDYYTRYASSQMVAKVARLLRVQTVGSRRTLMAGKPIDIGSMFEQRDGRTRLSIIYLNGLVTQEDKDFFVAVFVQELYRWMLDNPSPELQGLFYLDEIAPFLPPVRKTACKEILRLTFKQARKYGVGCLIATQNPGDIDYTALAQFGTWGLGKLLAKQDRKKVEGAIKSLAPNAKGLVDSLAGSKIGEFMLLSPDNYEEVKQVYVRWLISAHEALDEDAIRELPIPIYAIDL